MKRVGVHIVDARPSGTRAIQCADREKSYPCGHLVLLFRKLGRLNYLARHGMVTIVVLAGLATSVTSCDGGQIPNGRGVQCRALSNCLGLVQAIDGGKRLQLPNVAGYTMRNGNVVHGALSVTWGLTLNYKDPITDQAFGFIAEPASAVSPWCAANDFTTVETTSTGRTVCLYLYGPGSTVAFVSSGVRYGILLDFKPRTQIPSASELKSEMLGLISTVK